MKINKLLFSCLIIWSSYVVVFNFDWICSNFDQQQIVLKIKNEIKFCILFDSHMMKLWFHLTFLHEWEKFFSNNRYFFHLLIFHFYTFTINFLKNYLQQYVCFVHIQSFDKNVELIDLNYRSNFIECWFQLRVEIHRL